jgi:hypothetical protein
MAFIVDIKLKTRIPGESWDVLGKYSEDDPIVLGTVTRTGDKAWLPKSEDPVYRHRDAAYPSKADAISHLCFGLTKHFFGGIDARYGKRTVASFGATPEGWH